MQCVAGHWFDVISPVLYLAIHHPHDHVHPGMKPNTTVLIQGENKEGGMCKKVLPWLEECRTVFKNVSVLVVCSRKILVLIICLIRCNLRLNSPPKKKKKKKDLSNESVSFKKKKKSSIIQLSSVHTVDLGVLHLFKQTFHLCRFSTLNLL